MIRELILQLLDSDFKLIRIINDFRTYSVEFLYDDPKSRVTIDLPYSYSLDDLSEFIHSSLSADYIHVVHNIGGGTMDLFYKRE